ncbi:hypothetical protein PbJCM13498_35790 [Prolixibacter bellariivorans]|uniref:Cthe-2314-like HEPN domain-containing protein n=1 Tax=Prolixibacter bellariivorans TaxID=314319 RepID=A0A5M4B4B0_9BACT|nr:hypothetical protein [Prolixibacter bellariivorans]GET34716.1 hypothetical protein PbJCM13498_35790 [Prolixibacter bellariivorans]
MKKDFDISPRLSNRIVHSLTESLYASGIFTDDDIKDKKSLCFALERIIDNGGIDELTVDYTQSLTAKARKYKNSNELDYARIFYATYFEHEVNALIYLFCLRNKIDNKTQTAIIQSVNIWGKFTWLLQLMNYPKINKNHLNTIKMLADSRNSFIHYKWKDTSDFHSIPDSEKEQEKIDNEFERIEKAVKYFRNYCSKIKFKGNKSRIKKLIK